MSNDKVSWISDQFGINIQIKPTKRGINALKKFIGVLEMEMDEPEKEIKE